VTQHQHAAQRLASSGSDFAILAMIRRHACQRSFCAATAAASSSVWRLADMVILPPRLSARSFAAFARASTRAFGKLNAASPHTCLVGDYNADGMSDAIDVQRATGEVVMARTRVP